MKTLLLFTALFVNASISGATPGDTLLSIPNASFPRLLTDERGNPVITWIERTETSLSLMHRQSVDGGHTFGAPVRISLPPTAAAHGEDTPTLVFKGDGTQLVVFSLPRPTSDALRAGNLMYKLSADQGKTWTREQPIHRDTLVGKSHSYAGVSRLPSGEIGLVWLDEKLPGYEGRTVRYTQTLPGGGFAPEIVVDSNACPCCRPSLIATNHGHIYLIYRDLIAPQNKPAARDIRCMVSTDGGLSFGQSQVLGNDNWQINACPHSGPQVFSRDETVYATWYSGASGREGIRLTRLDKLQTPELIAGYQCTHPQISGWPDGRLALAWEELVGEAPDAYRRIMVRLYSATGQTSTMPLTAAGELTSLPVLLPTQAGLLVAYQVWHGQQTSVSIKQIPFL